MGKKVLVTFVSKQLNNEIRQFGNEEIVRKYPNCPLTLKEIREMENKIEDSLRQQGYLVHNVIILNVIPLGD